MVQAGEVSASVYQDEATSQLADNLQDAPQTREALEKRYANTNTAFDHPERQFNFLNAIQTMWTLRRLPVVQTFQMEESGIIVGFHSDGNLRLDPKAFEVVYNRSLELSETFIVDEERRTMNCYRYLLLDRGAAAGEYLRIYSLSNTELCFGDLALTPDDCDSYGLTPPNVRNLPYGLHTFLQFLGMRFDNGYEMYLALGSEFGSQTFSQQSWEAVVHETGHSTEWFSGTTFNDRQSEIVVRHRSDHVTRLEKISELARPAIFYMEE